MHNIPGQISSDDGEHFFPGGFKGDFLQAGIIMAKVLVMIEV